jgi:hypothetical protein
MKGLSRFARWVREIKNHRIAAVESEVVTPYKYNARAAQ